MKTLVVFVFAVCMAVASVSANDALCAGQPQNSFVANPENCNYYFLCQNERAIQGTCPTGAWFDPTRQVCAPPGAFCTQPPCLDKTGVFVPDPSACGNWHFCRDGAISHSATCPYGLSFVEASQYCTYPLCSEDPAAVRNEIEAPHIVM